MNKKSVSVNIAVPGKFHFLNYPRYLSELVELRNLWYSHKKGSMARYGLDPRYARNYPLSQYLIQGHARLLGSAGFRAMVPIYHRLWTKQVDRNWATSDVLHVLNMGAAVPLIRRAKAEGSTILCETVNTHPLYRQALLRREAEKWGTSPRHFALTRREELQISETELCENILAPSRIVKASYQAGGGTEKSYSILPYAVDVSRFKNKKEPWSGGTLRILSVGQIGFRKGQLHLLDAISGLSDRCHLELTLVGNIDPLARSAVQKFAKSFRHLEFVPYERMPEIFAHHDVYVAASIEEGLALSICEALAAGLAVVATAESGAEEIIQDGVNGILVAASSANDIALALEKLASSPEMLNKLALEGRKAIDSYLNWEKYADGLSSIYSQLVNEP